MTIRTKQFTSGGLVKTSVQVSPDQLDELEGIAEADQVAVAAVIRAAIREFLAGRRMSAEKAA